MHETRLRYTEPLLREAIRQYFVRAVIRQLGVGFFVALGFIVLMIGWLLYTREAGLMVGFLIASVVFFVIAIVAIYVAHYRNTLGRFRRMGSPEATFSYDEETFRLTSDLGSTTMPWSTIKEVWRYPRFWLFFFSPSQFVTLPLDCLDEATREFITRKVGQGEKSKGS